MSSKKSVKKKKRDLDKYPALNPKLNARTRSEVLDMDYLKKLNREELEFMNQFMAEYVSGAFKKDEDGNYSEDNFHKTAEERRECYNRNNTRNRCSLTIANVTGMSYRCDDIIEYIDSLNSDNFIIDNETNIIDFIIDEYDGDSGLIQQEVLAAMLEDYATCLNPISNSDRKLAESNYGKMLLSKFKDAIIKKKG